VAIRARREGEHELVLEVEDDGVGIPESLDWRNAPSLGLQLVQRLTKQLRGTIDLDRSSGTRFTIRFSGKVSTDPRQSHSAARSHRPRMSGV
jgi:two-component sensor histidine kinase